MHEHDDIDRLHRAATHDPDPRRAAAELAAQLGDAASAAVLFFCAPSYPLAALAEAMRSQFTGVLVGCTGSGQIGPLGYQAEGIVALGFPTEVATVRAYPIAPLDQCEAIATRVAEQVVTDLSGRPGRRAFGLILADGLSLAEERLAATLYQSLGDIPIVGGSAGDDLRFEHTFVFVDGEFVERAAAFVTIETSLPFRTLKFQHFVPTSRRLVITDADPARRIVTSINGRPAATAYAELVGVPRDRLDAHVFSANPLMLRIGDEYYVRSIQKVHDDGSMTFLCAIDVGLVLTVGTGVDLADSIERGFAGVPDDVQAVIGCDCILRRLEVEDRGLRRSVGEQFARRNVVGFSTYGEQYNGVHVNQTFVGVALGGTGE